MSQWGKRERINIPNVITANLNSRTVNATGTGAFGNVRVYDSIALGNVMYRVANVVTTTQITLDVPFESANVNLSNSYIRQTPKDITTYGWGTTATAGANTINLRNVYGVNRIEAANTQNKARGMTHTGWVKYNTYTTTQGQVRNKVEVLVAMSKNFNANVSGNVYPDAEDNTVIFSGGGDGV